MSRTLQVETAVQRGLSKARAEAFALALTVDAQAHVVAFLDRYPRPSQRAQAGEALRDAAIASNARADSLAEACALQSISRRLVPDARCPKPSDAAGRAAERLFSPKREAA